MQSRREKGARFLLKKFLLRRKKKKKKKVMTFSQFEVQKKIQSKLASLPGLNDLWLLATHF